MPTFPSKSARRPGFGALHRDSESRLRILLGFLPTFIDLSAMTFFDALVAVVVVSFVISSVLAAYACAGAQARRMLRGGRAARHLHRVSGVVMVGAGTAVIARA
jgi:threonine/homoserine/homoserine lactone efflux protein